jgi:hypothetical protein
MPRSRPCRRAQQSKAPEWDGVGRLDHWLVDYFGVEDTEYARCVGRWWLISAVARVFKPGCKADHVLILEGLTGTFKSTAIATLVPRREWFSDTPFVIGDKDGFLSLAGRWIQELAELDSLTRSDPARSKAFFSSGIDSYRPRYGRSVVQVPRQCVFVGTVNPSGSGYLVDETGNRRFWPVTCRTLDLPNLAAARDQRWAEATAMLRPHRLDVLVQQHGSHQIRVADGSFLRHAPPSSSRLQPRQLLRGFSSVVVVGLQTPRSPTEPAGASRARVSFRGAMRFASEACITHRLEELLELGLGHHVEDVPSRRGELACGGPHAASRPRRGA